MEEKVVGRAEPIRPFCLEYADAQNEVFAAINGAMQKYHVPMFLMENILTGALQRVREGAEAERNNAARSYQKQLNEFQKTQKREEPEHAKIDHQADA